MHAFVYGTLQCEDQGHVDKDRTVDDRDGHDDVKI